MKKFRISLRYYRSMLPACLGVTAVCGWLAAVWKIPEVIPMLFFIKAVTLFLLLTFAATLRPREFYYYYNLGVSKIRLWIVAAAVDLVIFTAVIALIYSIFKK